MYLLEISSALGLEFGLGLVYDVAIRIIFCITVRVLGWG